MSVRAILLVLMQPPPSFEEEFNCWYDTEHVPERLALPGFESARRYVSPLGWPRYMALYDLADVAALDSPEYRSVGPGHFSPWTRRVQSRVRSDRMVGVQLYPGDAATLPAPRTLLLRFAAAERGAEADLLARLRSACEGTNEILQLRLFSTAGEAETSYLALIGSASTAAEVRIDLPALGPWAPRINLANTYTPY
jgi:hypothetical protein